MTELRLKFLGSDGQAADLALEGQGVAIAVDESDGPRRTDGADAQFKVVADDLACWLHVYGERNSVHLNGRPVMRLAHVRAGDRIFLDGHPFHVVGDVQRSATGENAEEGAEMPSYVLRGLSGEQFGNAIPVETEMQLGSGARADLRLDDPQLPAEVATLTPTLDGLRFHVTEPHASQVNGLNIRSGVLEAGDQWTLAGKYRFAVESPDFLDIVRPDESAAERAAMELNEQERRIQAERRKLTIRLAWLIGVCAVISAIATALIVYAPH